METEDVEETLPETESVGESEAKALRVLVIDTVRLRLFVNVPVEDRQPDPDTDRLGLADIEGDREVLLDKLKVTLPLGEREPKLVEEMQRVEEKVETLVEVTLLEPVRETVREIEPEWEEETVSTFEKETEMLNRGEGELMGVPLGKLPSAEADAKSAVLVNSAVEECVTEGDREEERVPEGEGVIVWVTVGERDCEGDIDMDTVTDGEGVMDVEAVGVRENDWYREALGEWVVERERDGETEVELDRVGVEDCEIESVVLLETVGERDREGDIDMDSVPEGVGVMDEEAVGVIVEDWYREALGEWVVERERDGETDVELDRVGVEDCEIESVVLLETVGERVCEGDIDMESVPEGDGVVDEEAVEVDEEDRQRDSLNDFVEKKEAVGLLE